MSKHTIILILVASLTLAVPSTAFASDATLVKTLVTWSQKIGADSRAQQAVSKKKSVSLAQVKAATTRVLNDAVAAGNALAKQKPTTSKGARVKALSVKAFRLFAQGERELLGSLDAAGRADAADASAHASKAMTIVGKAAGLLLQAGNLAAQL